MRYLQAVGMTGLLPVACISFFGADGIAGSGSFGKRNGSKSFTIWFESRNTDLGGQCGKPAVGFIHLLPDSIKSSSADDGYFAFGAVCHKFKSCPAHHGPVAQQVEQRQQFRPAFLCFLYHVCGLKKPPSRRHHRRQCMCRLLQTRILSSSF